MLFKIKNTSGSEINKDMSFKSTYRDSIWFLTVKRSLTCHETKLAEKLS